MKDNLPAISKLMPSVKSKGNIKKGQRRKNDCHKTPGLCLDDSVYHFVSEYEAESTSSRRAMNSCFPSKNKDGKDRELKSVGKGAQEISPDNTRKNETKETKETPDMARQLSSDLCSICLDMPSDVVLKCLHAFCEDCITSWNVKSQTCPICRKGVDVEDKESQWVLAHETDNELVEMAKQSIVYVFDYVTKNARQIKW
eukprot:CAMPEP_0114516444 /NCGR_PEP_ID=MMETSP0109-20121206/17328_1 /TAXON_ID=29199 /ORGANISM="Chlorarachnion reptans, Strain CCCM449" /LENGTH=198 /DNA_ID=CAMNT_0001696827 /DNA_START=387 /DNA_END=986 /DNA_ORIENTATION=-